MDRIRTKKPLVSKKYRTVLLLVFIVVVLMTLLLARGGSSAFRTESQTLKISEIIEAPFQDYINVRARVEPAYMAYLDAVEGGIVEHLVAEEGALVNKGDTLLVLSNLNLNLNILNSEAQLAEKANFLRETQLNMEQQKLALSRELLRLDYDLVQMKRKHEQNKVFYADQLISKNEFLESEEAYALAVKLKKLSEEKQTQDALFRRTQVQKIVQNLKNMERNLDLIYQRQEHLTVRAPFSGQLASLNAIPGQSISAGHRLGQLNDLSAYKLQASIDEHYIDRIHIGLKAQLKRQDKTYTLTINKVYPEVHEGQFLVDLRFEEAIPENIRSGQTYSLSIQMGDAENGLLLPRGAFFQESGGHWVYRLSADGKEAIKHPIRIGRQNPKYYEVLEGLEAGDKVITSSYTLFNESERLILE